MKDLLENVKTFLDEKDFENKVTCLLSTYKTEQAMEKAFERLKFLSFFGFQFQVLPLKTVIEHQKDFVSMPLLKKVSEQNLLHDLREEREKRELESQKIEMENLRFELKMLKSEKKIMETDMSLKEKQLCSKENEIFHLKVQQKKSADDLNSTNTDIKIFEHLILLGFLMAKAKETLKSSKKASTKAKTGKTKPASLHGLLPYVEKKNEEYMNEKQREHFKNILKAWRLELMVEVDRTVSHMKDEAANFPDPADRATQEEEFSLELRTRDRERKLIKKIDKTLIRVEEDDYGFCDQCGIEVGIRRLEARPTADLCVDCKTLDEIKEKQLSG